MRSLRPVRAQWGPHMGVPSDLDPDGVEFILETVSGQSSPNHASQCSCCERSGDMYRLCFPDGSRFLDDVRNCDVTAVIKEAFGEGYDPDLRAVAAAHDLLVNLKAAEESWRRWLDEDGHLEIWVDAD